MGQTNAQKAAAAKKAEEERVANMSEEERAQYDAEQVKARADELNKANAEAEKARVAAHTQNNELRQNADAHGLLPNNDPATVPTEVQDLEKRRAELQAEIAELQEQKKAAVQAAVNVDASIEDAVREDYFGGSMNYLQLAKKYRLSEGEVRRIVGDTDLVDEGTSLYDLPEEV